MSYKKNTSILAPEEVNKDTLYTFSLNPDDDHQFWKENNSLQRELKFTDFWRKFLERYLTPVAQYDIHLEVSRLGRLHFHGTIQFKDIKEFYLYTLHWMLHICQIEIDTIKDPLVWKEYCTKQNLLKFNLVSTQFKVVLTPIEQFVKFKNRPIVEKDMIEYDDCYD